MRIGMRMRKAGIGGMAELPTGREGNVIGRPGTGKMTMTGSIGGNRDSNPGQQAGSDEGIGTSESSAQVLGMMANLLPRSVSIIAAVEADRLEPTIQVT
jgi:hypothetical protein